MFNAIFILLVHRKFMSIAIIYISHFHLELTLLKSWSKLKYYYVVISFSLERSGSMFEALPTTLLKPLRY